jgi:hypothetical protein
MVRASRRAAAEQFERLVPQRLQSPQRFPSSQSQRFVHGVGLGQLD